MRRLLGILPPRAVPRLNRSLMAYVVALCVTFLVIAVKAAFPFYNEPSPFLWWPMAVVLVAWYGGFYPGMLCAALAGAFVFAWVFPDTTGHRHIYGALQLAAWEASGAFLAYVAGLRYDERERSAEIGRRSQELGRYVSDGIVTIDQDSTILSCNLAFERLFGYGEHELVGKRCTMLIPPDFHDAHLDGMRRYATTKRRTLEWDYLRLIGINRRGEEFLVEGALVQFTIDRRPHITAVMREVRIHPDRMEKPLREQLFMLHRRDPDAPGV